MRRAGSLLPKLLVAYLLPTLGLLGAFGWLAYSEADRRLEASLGRRLIGVAQAAATQIRSEAITFLTRGDDQSRTARRMQHKLVQLQERTRVARVVVLDLKLQCKSDSHGKMRIGDRYYNAEADRHELGQVFAGKEASSVLFRGKDGQLYKTGYAPLYKGEAVVAAVGVEGSPEYFEALARLRNVLLLTGLAVAALTILIAVLVARRITRPLRDLAEEAHRIGHGDLETPIRTVAASDEVGLLAGTMNEMRQGLFERDQQMQLMLSGIAHEVRNPLGGMELFTGLLHEELDGDQGRLELLERIERELAYLKKVVEDFLDYARRRTPEMRGVPLSPLLIQAAEILSAEAAERGVDLTLDLPEGDLVVMGDAEQLHRVLLNLGRNALQATGEGKTVILAGRAVSDEEACMEVVDQGPGIPEEKREEIFAPFFTTREKGSGLGLALARKVVMEHGGRVELESAKDQGSTFRVILSRLEILLPATEVDPGEGLIG